MNSFFIILLIVGILLVCVTYLNYAKTEGFQTSDNGISLRPTLWWFVDNETNARHWWDFGARNSQKPNRGYLEVALKAAHATQAVDFHIVPLIGRKAVSRVISEAGEYLPKHVDQLPARIWRQWAIANLLAVKGGLVMVGDSTLCVGPSFGPIVKNAHCAVFGITENEPRVNPGATVPPSSWVGWSVRPHHPVWDLAATTWNRLSDAGPTAWSAAEARRIGEKIWESQKLRQDLQHFQQVEGSRKTDGTQLTAEDFLQKQVNPLDPKVRIGSDVIYIALDGDSLVRDYRYSWFVRMSKDQILESNFYWAVLAKRKIRNQT